MRASSRLSQSGTRINSVLWLNGYNAKEERGTVIDFAHLGTYTEKVAAFCAKNPKIGLQTASEKFSGDNMPKPGKSAVDVSTQKCSSIKGEPDEQTVFGIMWLAGWYAALANESSFDLTEFQGKLEKFGEYCAKNPSKGFNTAAKAVFTE